MKLAHDRFGEGAPLLLVHGIGSHRKVWRLVLDRLAAERDVIAIDLPGFGDSAPLPGDTVTPAQLAAAVAAFLDDIGLDRVDVAGNSLGGWVGFELAAAGRATSVTGLGAAGLYTDSPSRSGVRRLVASRRLARAARPALPRLLRSRAVRTRSFRDQCVHAADLPYAIALEAASAYGACPGFESVLRGSLSGPFSRGAEITVPVTAAYGDDDRIIPRSARIRSMLPAHTTWLTFADCGHVPMWDDPDLVASTILKTGTDG
jgi:pimeloyl-ACP methyl ester carboxylesterase